MVKIRLARIGEKKVPMYRIVVADSRTPRNGSIIAQIGTFNPNVQPHDLKVDAELAKEWLSKGAQPTTVVAKLFRQAGVNK
ncbi:30S ribosomal protein S16 [Lachnoclostridium sp. Marseille-P6806]|uniref:30S ribosomal protein S16 n=1 Tax=Lachnoclostridium sp. Marseille-P6806 TaxID=2364793 RepID=UPI001030AC14|nr:30S ribosomal protein S16 [Lachnoclostridium sp. Marseille-P6806]